MATSTIKKTPKWRTPGLENCATVADVGFTAEADGICWIGINVNASLGHILIQDSNGKTVLGLQSANGGFTSGVFPITKGESYSYRGGSNLSSPIYRWVFYF